MNAVSADVSADELSELQADPTIMVVPDVPVSVAGEAQAAPRLPASVYRDTTGATQLDKDKTGKGVTVAVLDTGIAPYAKP